MATKAERQWLDTISRMGCVVCILQGLGPSPAEPHHLLRKSGRRMGHLFTIPLCPPHHRLGRNDEEVVSRHPYRVEFERRYGTETQLLEQTQEFVGMLAEEG